MTHEGAVVVPRIEEDKQYKGSFTVSTAIRQILRMGDEGKETGVRKVKVIADPQTGQEMFVIRRPFAIERVLAWSIKFARKVVSMITTRDPTYGTVSGFDIFSVVSTWGPHVEKVFIKKLNETSDVITELAKNIKDHAQELKESETGITTKGDKELEEELEKELKELEEEGEEGVEEEAEEELLEKRIRRILVAPEDIAVTVEGHRDFQHHYLSNKISRVLPISSPTYTWTMHSLLGYAAQLAKYLAQDELPSPVVQEDVFKNIVLPAAFPHIFLAAQQDTQPERRAKLRVETRAGLIYGLASYGTEPPRWVYAEHMASTVWAIMHGINKALRIDEWNTKAFNERFVAPYVTRSSEHIDTIVRHAANAVARKFPKEILRDSEMHVIVKERVGNETRLRILEVPEYSKAIQIAIAIVAAFYPKAVFEYVHAYIGRENMTHERFTRALKNREMDLIYKYFSVYRSLFAERPQIKWAKGLEIGVPELHFDALEFQNRYKEWISKGTYMPWFGDVKRRGLYYHNMVRLYKIVTGEKRVSLLRPPPVSQEVNNITKKFTEGLRRHIITNYLSL